MKEFNFYLEKTKEIGYVESFSHSIASLSGLPNLKLDEVVVTESGRKGMAIDLKEDLAQVLIFEGGELKVGEMVTRTGESFKIPVGEGLLGRIVNPLMKPLDGLGFYFQATIIKNIRPEMRIYREETFGPVFSIFIVDDADAAITLANNSDFGLGGSLWTSDDKKGIGLARQIESGAIFVNGMTKSDPRLPFGGIKKSGFGRELSHYGIKEFVNMKTIWIK